MTDTWTPPPDIDKECIALCRAMNLVPGIQTTESCCGHGERPFRVWFKAARLRALPKLLYYFAACHSGVRGWLVTVNTDCGMSPVSFCVTGPEGDYAGADQIAGHLTKQAP